MPMQEFETGILRTQLCPQPPDAEITFSHIGIVEQDDRTFGQFRSPGFEVVTDRFIGVEPVDMQKIHRSVRYIDKRVVEGAAEEFGKSAEAFLMETPKIQIDFFPVISGLLVAFPCIHGKAASIQSVAHHRLAERRISDAVMSAEFDESVRFDNGNNPMSEGDMPVPGTDNTEASPTPEKRIQFWSPEIAQPFCIQRIAVMFAHGLFVSLRVAPIGGKNRFKLHVCPIMLCHGFLRRGADGISWKCGWKRTLGLWYGSAVSNRVEIAVDQPENRRAPARHTPNGKVLQKGSRQLDSRDLQVSSKDRRR